MLEDATTGGRGAGFSLRPIRASDDRTLAAIIRDVMTEYGACGAGFAILDAEVDAMHEAYAGSRAAYFVVETEAGVVGGAGIGPLDGGPPEVCELRKMYLRPAARGLGAGRALLALCLEAARGAGYERCYLETLSHMTRARELYERSGFRPLEAPLGDTGHFGCNTWYVREL
jgi:putative acetyltransferase